MPPAAPSPPSNRPTRPRALILAGSASALAMLLRPDGALLSVALAAGFFFYILRAPRRTSPRPSAAPSPPHRSFASSLSCPLAVGRSATGPIPGLSAARSALSQRSRRTPHRRLLSAGFAPGPSNTSPPPLFSGTSPAIPSTPPICPPAPSIRPQRAQTLALLDEYNHTILVSADRSTTALPRLPRNASAPTPSAITLCFRCCASPTCCFVPAPGVRSRCLLVALERPSRANHLGHSARSHQSLLCRRRRLGFPSPPRPLAVDAGRLHHPALFAAWHYGKLRAALFSRVFPDLHRRRRRNPQPHRRGPRCAPQHKPR